MQPNYMSIRNQHPSDPSSNLGPQLQQAQHQNIDKKWEPMFNFYSGHPEKRDAHPVESLIAQESVAHNSPTENAMFYRTVIPIDRFYAPTLGFNFEGIEMPNEIDYEYMIPVETAPASLGAKNWLGGLKIESGSRSEISAKKPKLSFCCSIFNPSFPQYPTPKVKRDNYDPDSSKNINSLTNFFLDPNKRDFVNFQPLEDTFLRDHIQDSLYFY